MVLVQKELKNAYIGEVLHINSDLRGATLAGLQAQGWDGIAYRYNTYTLSSSGLQCSTTSNDVAFLYKNIPELSSTSKIEMNITGNVVATTAYNGEYIGYTMNNTSVFPAGFSSSVRAGYKTGTQQTPYVIAYNDGTSLGTLPTGDTGGLVVLNIKLDLSTGLLEYKLTGPKTHTTTATLTSAQLTNVITYKNVGVICQNFGLTPSPTIYTVELIVE